MRLLHARADLLGGCRARRDQGRDSEPCQRRSERSSATDQCRTPRAHERQHLDRKSTRLNSSHVEISYAVFCLKKKKKKQTQNYTKKKKTELKKKYIADTKI